MSVLVSSYSSSTMHKISRSVTLPYERTEDMGKYFGTDGFRGEANITLTSDHAYRIGRFLGWWFGARTGHRARVVIGKDTRRSSYMFEYSIVAGLTSTGADAHMLHVTTTPSVAYVTRVDNFDCGIMITASHKADKPPRRKDGRRNNPGHRGISRWQL